MSMFPTDRAGPAVLPDSALYTRQPLLENANGGRIAAVDRQVAGRLEIFLNRGYIRKTGPV